MTLFDLCFSDEGVNFDRCGELISTCGDVNESNTLDDLDFNVCGTNTGLVECGKLKESLQELRAMSLSITPEGEPIVNGDGVTADILGCGTVTVLVSCEDATDVLVGAICGFLCLNTGERFCGVATILAPPEEGCKVVSGDANGFNFCADAGDSF